MKNGTTPPPPPPYSPPEANEAEAFVDRCVRAIHDGDTTAAPAASPDDETNRVRNLLLFTLSTDYQCNAGVALSVADNEHFVNLNNTIRDLYQSFDEARPTNAERSQLAPYFWKYLHDPCRDLGVPVELVVKAIDRLYRFVDWRGTYKGCCFSVLHLYGLEWLARKIWCDAKIIVPAVIRPGAERENMLRAIDGISRLYFTRIHGLESATLPMANGREWGLLQTISHDANERGRSYEKWRKYGTLACNMKLSMSHLTQRATEAVSSVLQRRRRVQDEKQVADGKMTWQGDGHPYPKAHVPRPYHENEKPSYWNNFPSLHIPDFFEVRDAKACSEA